MWKKIYTRLKSDGIAVFSPGQHTGDCISPYVVLKTGSCTKVTGASTERALYEVLCYIPVESYSTLEDYLEEVKLSLKKLYPALVSTHSQTPVYLDDTIKGYMVSIQYRAHKKLN